MNEEKCIQIALFRYGIISDFVNRKYMARGEKEELLRNKSSCIWKIPHSDRKYISPSTIFNWIQCYENGERSLEALYPHPRCDAKISRTIDKISGQNLIHLLKSSTISSVQNLIKEMRIRALVEPGTSLNPSNVYRFLNNHGLIECLKRRKGQRKKNKESTGKSKFWMRKLSLGQIEFEELGRDFSSKISAEDLKLLFNCLLMGPQYLKRRAFTILSFLHGISAGNISDFYFIPKPTVLHHLSLYRSEGISRLLQAKRRTINKFKDPKYAKELFSILHAPPSAYGFNRSTWRQEDLQNVMIKKGCKISKAHMATIIKNAGYRYRKAKIVLTSNDPEYQEKVKVINNILANLKPNEKFLSVDEYGPFAVKLQGGRSLTPPGQIKTVPQWQKNKGTIIITAALELSKNQITHFYSSKKDSCEMIKLLEILVDKYREEDCLYFSWDAASWHASKQFLAKVKEINENKYQLGKKDSFVKLAPLPTGAQFLNVIESIFSGMARAIIHNSNYSSVSDCISAIDRYFLDRNRYFKDNPKKAGRKIWGEERVEAVFEESNNCKDPMYR